MKPAANKFVRFASTVWRGIKIIGLTILGVLAITFIVLFILRPMEVLRGIAVLFGAVFAVLFAIGCLKHIANAPSSSDDDSDDDAHERWWTDSSNSASPFWKGKKM
jgi:hypothetical protein